MKDFNIAKYLKEHRLGAHGMFNGYVDLQPLKEEGQKARGVYSDIEGAYDETQEVPYAGGDDNITGYGDDTDHPDYFEQDEIISEAPNRIDWEDLDDTDLAGSSMEMAIDDMIDDAQRSIEEYVASADSQNPRQLEAQIRLLIKQLWMQKIKTWRGGTADLRETYGAEEDQTAQAGTEEDLLAAMIAALQDAGFSNEEIENMSHTISNDPRVLDFGDF